LDLFDVVVVALQIDVLDGDQITSRLFNCLVDNTKASTAQLFQHLVIVGHGGLVESGVHFRGRDQFSMLRDSRGAMSLSDV